MAQHKNLKDWLQWLEQLHPQAIDLGLERVHQVASHLGLLKPASPISHSCSAALVGDSKVITVAGTNGKGSCIASLEQLLMANGSSVASYTSPHLHHFCERIRIDGQAVSESLVVEAFEAVDEARQSITLTYFEFGTLAALWIFAQNKIPFILLEVGLGGRLDAVNIIDADIAVITSIALDHQDWLGNDRETISREKLGVARQGRPLIIAEADATISLTEAAATYPAVLVNRDVCFEKLDSQHWRFDCSVGDQKQSLILPLPSLPLASVASALCVLELLGINIPQEKKRSVVRTLHLVGRFEAAEVKGISVIYDVAHNPVAASSLAQNLTDRSVEGQTLAVLALMADKDIGGVVAASANAIDQWFIGELKDVGRAASSQVLSAVLQEQGQPFQQFDSIEEGFMAALSRAKAHDRIVVFGSFYTVAKVQALVASWSDQ